MKITDIKVNLRDEEKLKGFVNITLDGLFVIRGLKIINGNKGYFVAMPARKRVDGSFRDVAHPICNEFRLYLEKRVLDKYWEMKDQYHLDKIKHKKEYVY